MENGEVINLETSDAVIICFVFPFMHFLKSSLMCAGYSTRRGSSFEGCPAGDRAVFFRKNPDILLGSIMCGALSYVPDILKGLYGMLGQTGVASFMWWIRVRRFFHAIKSIKNCDCWIPHLDLADSVKLCGSRGPEFFTDSGGRAQRVDDSSRILRQEVALE